MNGGDEKAMKMHFTDQSNCHWPVVAVVDHPMGCSQTEQRSQSAVARTAVAGVDQRMGCCLYV